MLEAAVSPMPLISRGVPVFASGSAPNVPPSAANDANEASMWVSNAVPAWIAYDLSGVPVSQRQQVLVAWYASWALGYINPTPAPDLQIPIDYTIETNNAPGGGSNAPVNGWQLALSVTGNNRGTRQHLLNLAGANWIRLRATASSNPASIAIDFEVHSAPDGASDCWLFMGDSISGVAAYLFSDLPKRVNSLAQDRWPVIVPAAIGGSNAWSAFDVIDETLSLFPGRFVTLNYGTNGGSDSFSVAMEKLIQKVIAAGKIPVIPHMPWSDIPDQLTKAPLINAQIDALYIKYPTIIRGPDLYTAFLGHNEWIPSGDVHPNDAGNTELRRQWALAMSSAATGITPPSSAVITMTVSDEPTENPTAPVINSFTIDSTSLSTSGMCTLHWNVTGTANLSITPSVGTVTGSTIAVSPLTDTTYTLTAINSAGTDTATAAVTLSTPAPTLEAAPVLKINRDDHVATVEMDFDDTAWAQLWDVGTAGREGCGYRVQWWADASAVSTILTTDGCTAENSAGSTASLPNMSAPRQLVTPNRVVQIQPIANNALYHVRVERLNGLGQICSEPTEMTFNGGDGTRVAVLRSSLTFFDDFNLPMGAPDERKWNNAMTPQTDPRYNLFFINDQCHVHTLNGTLNDAAGDKSQVAQRARKPIAIETGVRRRIVFDMDGIFSPRGVWYLDFNPVSVDLTGHMSFFDEDGEKALPAGVLRLKAGNQSFSVHLIDGSGASYKIAEVILYEKGRKMATNVRRSFDVRLGTDGVQVLVDGTSVIDTAFAPNAFKAGTYELLWSTIGYNSSKDNNPYFLSHWDNFGFDGPDLEPRAVHNYVTRIEGTDYQHANTGNGERPTFTVNIPDDIRPVSPGATSEAWLVFNYMVDRYNYTTIKAGDHVLVNGTRFSLPPPANNTVPLDPELSAVWNNPTTVRLKLGEVQQGGVSPVRIGDNALQFFAENTGILNVHIEVLAPKSAEPPYTPPAALHRVPTHAALPKLGPPAQFIFLDGKEPKEDAAGAMQGPTLTGKAGLEVLVGNTNWANWAPELMNMPANSAEIWSSGGTTGIQTVELFLRRKGTGTGPGDRIAVLTTARDAAAPQVRYTFEFDTRQYANGDYEIFVLGTTAGGVKSHPEYPGSAFRWDSSEWSGAYEPVMITIAN